MHENYRDELPVEQVQADCVGECIVRRFELVGAG